MHIWQLSGRGGGGNSGLLQGIEEAWMAAAGRCGHWAAMAGTTGGSGDGKLSCTAAEMVDVAKRRLVVVQTEGRSLAATKMEGRVVRTGVCVWLGGSVFPTARR